MVEPLSIVTAVAGFISFTITVRNSISTILNDINAIETDGEDLVPTGIRLTLIIQRIRL